MTVDALLDRALAGQELTVEEAARLFSAEGESLDRLLAAADDLRSRRVGDRVTYVVNRNINFTNVCVKRCGFCAFSRGHRAAQGYFLPLEEVLRRAREAWELGATEVCIQAGLAPRMNGRFYIDLCAAIKREVPEIHVHAFSPEEVLYGATLSGCTIEEYLAALKDVGLGSLPGTSAEILDDRVREVISPGRIFNSALDRGHSHRSQARYSDHFHYHVWPCRNGPGPDQAPRSYPQHSKGNRRNHRVRAA
jgi:2-iminoacetate synthase ThiH